MIYRCQPLSSPRCLNNLMFISTVASSRLGLTSISLVQLAELRVWQDVKKILWNLGFTGFFGEVWPEAKLSRLTFCSHLFSPSTNWKATTRMAVESYRSAVYDSWADWSATSSTSSKKAKFPTEREWATLVPQPSGFQHS